MPAKTTNQLFSTHGQYLDASDSTESDFRAALNEVMPRIYKMGYWREMLVEHTQDASAGYVSLPQDTDSIVAAVIDNNATTTRSIWHDYKLFGTNDQDKTNLSSFIDDGYAPTYRDLVSGSNYQIYMTSLKLGGDAYLPNTGSVAIRYRQYSDATDSPSALVSPDTILKGSSYSEVTLDLPAVFTIGYQFNFGSDTDVTEVLSISWTETEEDHPFIVKAVYKGVSGGDAATDATKDLLLADVNTKNGVSRYRRYRIGGTNATSSAHMLLKKRWVDVDSTSDIVHFPASSILKHALLGKLSEDNADAQRAMYHWGVVKELLEADMDSYRGAAKPTLHIAPDGVGAGMSGMY